MYISPYAHHIPVYIGYYKNLEALNGTQCMLVAGGLLRFASHRNSFYSVSVVNFRFDLNNIKEKNSLFKYHLQLSYPFFFYFHVYLSSLLLQPSFTFPDDFMKPLECLS